MGEKRVGGGEEEEVGVYFGALRCMKTDARGSAEQHSTLGPSLLVLLESMRSRPTTFDRGCAPTSYTTVITYLEEAAGDVMFLWQEPDMV